MSLVILEDRASIQAAIATMNPCASEAAQLLAHRIFENPQIVEDNDALTGEWLQACIISARRSGIEDDAELRRFVEDHGQSVLNVAVSIFIFTMKAERRRRTWGWLGKVAAFAAGVIIASFFG